MVLLDMRLHVAQEPLGVRAIGTDKEAIGIAKSCLLDSVQESYRTRRGMFFLNVIAKSGPASK